MNTQEQDMVYGSDLITLDREEIDIVRNGGNLGCDPWEDLSPLIYIDGKDTKEDLEYIKDVLDHRMLEDYNGISELDGVQEKLDGIKTLDELIEYAKYVEDNNLSDGCSNGLSVIENFPSRLIDLSNEDYYGDYTKEIKCNIEKLNTLGMYDTKKPPKWATYGWDGNIVYGDVIFILAYLDILDTLDTKVNSIKDAYTLLDTKMQEDMGMMIDVGREVALSYYLRLFLVLESKRLNDAQFKAKYGPTKDQEGVCKIEDGLDLEQFNLIKDELIECTWVYEEYDYKNFLSD